MAALWLVSQQTDIYVGQWSWRVFNFILGGVHVFLFLNVKDGPSHFRMAGFYTVPSPVLMRAWDILVVFVEYLCLQCFDLCHLLFFWSVYTIKNTLSYSYIANLTLILFKEYEYAQCILEYGFKGIVHAKIGVITLSNRVKALLFLCCVGDAARKCYSAIGCIWHPDWCIMG